jgi:hypothetical protein
VKTPTQRKNKVRLIEEGSLFPGMFIRGLLQKEKVETCDVSIIILQVPLQKLILDT